MIWKYVRHLEISGCNDNTTTSMSITSYPLLNSLHINDNSFGNVVMLTISNLHNLKTIQINENSFGNVNTLTISNLTNLVSISIGQNSFTQSMNWYGLNTNRNAVIKNCTQLKELMIGNYAFSDYYSLEISSLPSLERLVFGEYSFYHSPSFVMESR